MKKIRLTYGELREMIAEAVAEVGMPMMGVVGRRETGNVEDRRGQVMSANDQLYNLSEKLFAKYYEAEKAFTSEDFKAIFSDRKVGQAYNSATQFLSYAKQTLGKPMAMTGYRMRQGMRKVGDAVKGLVNEQDFQVPVPTIEPITLTPERNAAFLSYEKGKLVNFIKNGLVNACNLFCQDVREKVMAATQGQVRCGEAMKSVESSFSFLSSIINMYTMGYTQG